MPKVQVRLYYIILVTTMTRDVQKAWPIEVVPKGALFPNYFTFYTVLEIVVGHQTFSNQN